MASTLINVALSSIRPAHASYYGDIDETNPVVCAAEKEIKGVLAYFTKKAATPAKTESEACSRGSNWLFDIWNKFEPRLPLELFYNKLIEVGDYLHQHGFYDVASRQCFGRYIQTRYKQLPYNYTYDVQQYKETYFDDKQDMQDSVLTSRAILGIYMCEYKSIFELDSSLNMCDSVEKIQRILHGLRTFMQCLLSYESLFWILYNCTIVMYQICRLLMTSGNSIKAIEFLLWAAVTMETSVPLLGVKYLTWRVTLYSAVCLAYYDCKAGHHAEAFARRALGKLQELSELERLSDSSESVNTQLVFRQATAKMASMVFKRSVYETRRKPKGMLRPKVKNNLKEAAQLTWPRTVTEKLLSEMFEGGAAQFLAILEALSDSHRRTLQTGPSSSDSDLNDVTAELFFAGKEIIAGGGGSKSHMASGADHSVLAGVRHDKSLIQLAAAGEDGVTLISVVRFIKLAFCFEQWSTFNTMLDCALIYIKKSGDGTQQDGSSEHSGTELCLALLLVMERLVHSRSQKRIATTTSGSVMPSGGDDTADSVAPPPTQGSIRSVQISDDLVNMAETVFYCINEPALFSPQGLDLDVLIDRDMIVDASLLLWQKCKMVFGKFHSGSRTDMGSILQKTGSPGKWIHILSIVHSSLMWSGIGAVDPELIAEVSLRLSLALESFAGTEGSPYQADDIGNASRHSMHSTLQLSPASQLGNALQVVKDGIESLTAGRSNMATNDAKFVADISWMPKDEQIVDDFTPTSEQFIRDLHVELLTIHHRIALKLINYNASQQSLQHEGNISSRTTSMIAIKSLTESSLNASVGGSVLSKAIMLMQKADQQSSDDSKTEKLLTKAAATIQKAQAEEKALFEDSWLRLNRSESDEEYSPIPPPPILLSRSPGSMTFKPAYFSPDGAKVAWYRIFGRLAAGSNVKVRLNDYYLPGTGEEVPAGRNCELRVDGLEPNQRYVFAVAAYTSDGKLIGGSVGTTGRSIVACHPLSVLSTWGFLAQMSYKLGCISVSKQACTVLWNHFVETESNISTEAWTSTSRQDFALTTYHLDQQVALASSPVLLRHALTSIFVGVETAVRENEVFCNKLCTKGPLMPSQISRLRECERMLVVMEIAGWLNDTSMLLQAVVQTYGLIAPIIQADVSVIPVLQVASRCHSALQEVSGALKLKKSSHITESLHHMVAVLTNYIAKVTKAYGKNQAALSAIESGKQMLRMEGNSFVLGESANSEEQSSAKRNKSRKAAVPEVVSNLELAALEERLAEMSRETRAAGELTGFEDASQILARLCRMKPIVAYRELAKFRRRNRYLEFFVFVLRKALRLQQIDLAIEWSKEVLTNLHRRNDTFAVNRSVVSKQPGGVAVQGDEARKYAAAVVEFSQDAAKKSKAKQKDKQKKLAILRKRSGPNPTSEGQEEAEINALCLLEQHYVEFYRNSVKRKKLRKISSDEMPWRAEFNHLMALLHYDVFLDKIRERNQMLGVKTPKSQTVEYLDQGWWSFDTCGTLVVGWSDTNQQQFHECHSEAETEVVRALEKAAQIAISSSLVAEPVPPPQPTSVSAVTEDEAGGRPDSGRTQRTNSPTSILSAQTFDLEVQALQPSVLLDCFKTSMLSFRRGLVLAHRGRHWTLLQNIAKSLMSSLASSLQAMTDNVEPTVTVEQIRAVVWQPVAIAADLLLDMLVQMQNVKLGGIWPVTSFVGDMTSVKGGTSLRFEEYVDDVSLADVPLVKHIVMQALQLLHFESRWEGLVDICLRFSALTHDRYSDIVSPVLIHAQHRLRDRVRIYAGEQHPQSHFVGAAQELGKKKVDNRDYLRHNLQVNFLSDASSIGVGGHIDPASHDVYGSGRRALALSCVPFDPVHSMELLRMAMSQSQYMSRALQHSRRLLSIYLASQHSRGAKSRKTSAKLDSASSCVEFTSKHEEPHSSSPPDVTNLDFHSTDVIETLASSQLSTVIQSYNRTIELLMSHGERDMVAQASNELADLFYHQGNKRAAHKWWNTALDNILGLKDSIHQWRSSVKDNDNIPSHFLKTCGVWGCLLAISLTCKIGELTAVDVSMKTGCALVAADLVRAIFRSSLPHPTADFDYASYEVVPTVSESSLLTSPSKSRSSVLKSRVQACNVMNGIDIFSDRFRCNLQSLVASVHWLCDTLVTMKFSLPALPSLTFYQYLATFVCRDLQRSVHCRCLKLSALTDLRMFKEATSEALNLLYGVRLPHSSDVAYRPPDTPVPTVVFNTKKQIEDVENLKAMEVVASKRVSSSLSTLYGPHLTCEVTLGQARLLVHLASCITKIPQKPTATDLQFVSPDFQTEIRHRSQSLSPKSGPHGKGLPHLADDVRSNISAFSTASASKYVNKLFTKRDRPVGQQLLKGMLLSVAEHLTAVMAQIFKTSDEPLTASELYLLVSCHYLLSEIHEQRQLSTVSAAEALSALHVLQNSSLFDQLPTHTTRKLRSALRKKKLATDTTERSNTQIPQQEPFQVVERLYRARLNARLWLDCRLRMCRALATQVKGLGKVGNTAPDSAGLLDHSQVQLYCAEGLAEAEACDDVEMQALFLILGSTLDGISIQESMHMLEDASASLDDQAELSNRAALGLIECTTRFADFSVISGSSSGPESIISYKSAHSVLLLKAMQEGEIISHRDSGGELSTVASPPRNIYSTYPNLLAQIKLRFAHAMLQTESVDDDHQVAAQLLMQARSLSSMFVGKETQLMADVQIELGKVQRMLIRSGQAGPSQSKAAHASLREAVKLSETQTSDLTTVRQAHLETALVDLATIETKYSEVAQPPTELDRASSSPSVSAGIIQPNPGQRSFSLDVGVVSQPLEHTQAKLRVATALFSAYHAARGNQQRSVLPGNPQVTALNFNPEDKAALPDFVLLDLTTDHSQLPWTSPGDDVTVEPLLNAIRVGNNELTWIHVLMYYVLLQRKCRLSTLVSGGNTFDEDQPPSSSEGSDRMTSFELGGKSTPVRLPLNSGYLLLRISALHEYLVSRLPAYAATGHVPPLPRGKNYVALQWSREPGQRNTSLLWSVYHADGATVDCGRGEVPSKSLDSIATQVNALRKRTEEFFGRVSAQAENTGTRRKKSQRTSVVINIDAQLEEDWKHLLNQISGLVSGDDEPIAHMPFDINLESAQSVVDLFANGCCVDATHFMYKWLVQLLCPV